MQLRQLFIILIFLVVIFIAGLFYFLIYNTTVFSPPTRVATATTAPTPSPTVGLSTPKIIVDTFYQTHIDCLKIPSNNCTPRAADVDQEKIKSSYQRNAKYGDPITCSVTRPSGSRVDDVSPITEGKATAYVTEDFGGGVTKQVSVDIELESGIWKVINITCPPS